MGPKHKLSVRKRLFHIWQVTGTRPFHSAKARERKQNSFFKGSFDSIPFLNDDAKRTFVHLLFRPGYMIRDYLCGRTDMYLAPLTSLIIFYAFFAFASAALNPDSFHNGGNPGSSIEINSDTSVEINGEDQTVYLGKIMENFHRCYMWIHLDQNPQAVDTKFKASVASLENYLRGQGVYEFLWQFLALWFALWVVLHRRYAFSLSAAATVSAYVLCQHCFFRLFILVFSWGRDSSISLILMTLILMFDFVQMLGIKKKMSLKLSILTLLMILVFNTTAFVIVGTAISLISLL